MKRNWRLLASALVMCVVVAACEKNDRDLTSEMDTIKKANNGMIKSYGNEMVLKWNRALSAAIDQKMPVAPEARIYAMVSLAVHDALNNVVPEHGTYLLDNSGVEYKDISKKNIQSLADAAVAQSAHDMLAALVPAAAANAGVLLAESLAAIEDSELKDRGIAAGKAAAQAVLADRQGDPALGFAAYPQGTAPGEYRSTMPYAVANPPIWPNNAVYAPGMGTFRPFAMTSSDQFRAEPPYSLVSPEYAADYDEVKRLGSSTSTERTPEQAELALFYLDNMGSSANRIARFMAEQEELDGWETAKLLALLNMAQFDACLSSFEGAYYYNRWRPITAIRMGETDGNDATAGDPAWATLPSARAVPPIPTYPAAYTQMAGATAEILRLFFKEDEKSFTIGSYSLAGAEKSYTTFSAYAEDVSMSRIYAGFQFRHDVEAGERMGRELARYIFETKFRDL
ncbi:MAG TPA: vanadium-dependent haloperoxidase [Prolixibacteraceae bacterium]|nr:vanadium-dependent haloperoxidase [Prolixibacteraceae bacterium]